MTVVVGIRHRGGVVLAADTQGTSVWSGDYSEREDAKTFQLSETVAVAFCGSYRIGQVLRHCLTLPRLGPEDDVVGWAVKTFVPAARSAVKEHGALKISDGVERLEGPFLLAARDRLFAVQGDWQVGETVRPWACLGSGGSAAEGHLLQALDWTTARAINTARAKAAAEKAVTAAAALNAFVGGRVTTAETSRWSTAEQRLARHILTPDPNDFPQLD